MTPLLSNILNSVGNTPLEHASDAGSPISGLSVIEEEFSFLDTPSSISDAGELLIILLKILLSLSLTS